MLKKLTIFLSIILLTGCSKINEITCIKEEIKDDINTSIIVKADIKRNDIDKITINGVLEYDDESLFKTKCDELKSDNVICEENKIIEKNIQTDYLSKENIDTIKKMSIEKYIKQMEEIGYKCEKK